MTLANILLLVYLGYLLFMSIISFCLFGKDKDLAKLNRERIKEKTLLGVTSLGGAIGSLVGSVLFHHKTEKKYFSFVIFISIALEIFTGACLFYLALMK